MRSGLYTGLVTHARTRPRRHELAYRVYTMLIDLDELEALDRRFRWFSVDRFNLLAFHGRDHGDGSARPLKAQITARLAEAGIAAGGAIQVLCYPRVLGGVFNPLSTYFCHRPDGSLAAVLYEVNNTFGQRHSYLIEVDTASDRPIRQHCDKAFYVSPFMAMDMRYDFAIHPPAEDVSVTVRGSDAEGTLITANFTGARREVSDSTLLAAFLRHPLLTLKVVGGIHWEALKIIGKGIGLQRRPPPPERAVTVVRSR
ncbi:MAG: DUF1365 family protein [Alphaproteobacteria bacterium]|nr:DUF1365 family protein [Alphaproteobacteria bacterium]